jgi:hypothetical protein
MYISQWSFGQMSFCQLLIDQKAINLDDVSALAEVGSGTIPILQGELVARLEIVSTTLGKQG